MDIAAFQEAGASVASAGWGNAYLEVALTRTGRKPIGNS